MHVAGVTIADPEVSVLWYSPLSRFQSKNGYAVRHCEDESDWNAAVGMSRCA